MKNLLVVLFFLTFLQTSKTQNQLPYGEINSSAQLLYQKENKVFSSINLLTKYQNIYADTSWEKQFLKEDLALYQSFVGEEKEALSLSPLDTFQTNLGKFKTENPIPFILQQAENERMIMLNEAHHVPSCRLFLMNLLAPLKKQDYGILALEALAPLANDINTQGFPTVKDAYYAKEQVMAWAIRYAISLGYKVLPYEIDDNKCVRANLTDDDCSFLRENEQARKLNDIAQKYPNEKILVLAGYGHIVENIKEGKSKRVAQILKEKYAINPFTISQIEISMSQKSKLPFYSYALENETKEAIFSKKGVDLLIFHSEKAYLNIPFTFLKDFYPTQKQAIKINQIDNDKIKGILIQIYGVAEKEKLPNAVLPVIQKIVYKNGKYKIHLPKGKYEVILKNQDDIEVKRMLW